MNGSRYSGATRSPEAIDRRRIKASEAAMRRYWNRRALVDAYLLASGCIDCGRDDLPAEVLQLHHRNPAEKLFTVSRKLCTKSVEAILAEMQKCDVLCPTCHALRHYHEIKEEISL